MLKKGEKIRVIGRTPEHLQHLTEQGAEALIGDQANVEFLTRAFTGAEAAYVIVPPKFDTPDVRRHYNEMGGVIVEAIRRSHLKKVVFLSSLGAELDSGTGPVIGLHDVERALGALTDVDIVFLRAGYFYENTLFNIEQIKHRQANADCADPEAPFLMVAAKDIGQRVAELLRKRKFTGHTVEELFGERITMREVTEIIGKKLGIHRLPYVQASEKDAVEGMVAMGLSRNIAESFVELDRAIAKGLITTTIINAKRPNAPTSYKWFVEEVFLPAYRKAA